MFKAAARVASNLGVTPYNVDKLFWLIGSGCFYEDPYIGHKGRIGSLKKQFIEVAQFLGSNGVRSSFEGLWLVRRSR